MALPNSRLSLQDWCLRHCGAPIVKVNVAASQLSDCVDMALDYLQEYSEIGQERFYVVHELTQQEIDENTLNLTDNILAVSNISYTSGLFPNINWTNFLYDDVRRAVYNSMNGLTDYLVTRQYLANLQHQLSPIPGFDFRRSTGKLRIFDNISAKLNVGDKIIIDVIGIIDPDQNTKLWSNRMLRGLAGAYVKRQYGMNLLKFNDMPTPGGIIINAETIYTEALDEILKYETEIYNSQVPIGIITA